MRFTISILTLIFLFGCGRKYPIPPEYDYSLPPEESYVLVDNWPGEREYELNELSDVIVGKDGFIYALTEGDVKKLFENGQLNEVIIEGLSSPSAMHQDIMRNIYILDENIIRVFNRDGDSVYAFKDTSLVVMAGIATEGEKIFVSDSERDLVLSYDASGNLIDTVASHGAGILNVDEPLDLYIWEGEIFVVSSGHNWVEAISIDTPRVNLLHLGGETHEGDTLPGYFIRPVDVVVDDSACVYVADGGNQRIQKFDGYGDFVVETELSEVPVSVAVSSDGRSLYVGFTNRIEKYKRPETPCGGE
jgi:hypothetical protein